MKSYTDIEQSKKLAEILPLESADMYFEPSTGFCTEPSEVRVGDIKYAHPRSVLCWSLAALLNALPQYISKYIENERCQKTFHLNLFRSYYYCCSYSFSPSISDEDDSNTLYCVGRDNWIDACVDMIEKLHEQNLL